MSWNPLQDLFVLQDRMNRLFEDATQRRSQSDNKIDEFNQADWQPTADVYENETEFTIAIDLPGIDRNTLNLDVDEDRLIVRGERPGSASKPIRTERPSGSFARSFGVPSSVDQNKITATYKDGVLEVHLPRRSSGQKQRVEIKVS